MAYEMCPLFKAECGQYCKWYLKDKNACVVEQIVMLMAKEVK